MTPDAFRKMALTLPGAAEGEHMGHADFRIRDKIFATLGYPSAAFATLMLTPDEQLRFMHSAPDCFFPAKGAWGRKGSTHIRLVAADRIEVQRALRAAWQHKAAP
jgi:hypothetical protein